MQLLSCQAPLKPQPCTQVQVEGEANHYRLLLISLQSAEKQSLPLYSGDYFVR